MAIVIGAPPYPQWPEMRMVLEMDAPGGPRYVFWTQYKGDVITIDIPVTSSEGYVSTSQVVATEKAQIELGHLVSKIESQK